MKEVNKGTGTRPNNPSYFFASWSFQKDISSLPLSVGEQLVSSFYSCINDRNIVIIFKDIFHSIERESFFINGEILKEKHVIDVTPNCIKGYVILLVLSQNSFKVLYVLVAPSTLMEAHTPKWWNSGWS